jgi:hypothetical protein
MNWQNNSCTFVLKIAQSISKRIICNMWQRLQQNWFIYCTYGARIKSYLLSLSVHQKPLFALYNINYQWWNINWLITLSYHAYICTQIPTLCKTTCYEIRIQQRSGAEKKRVRMTKLHLNLVLLFFGEEHEIYFGGCQDNQPIADVNVKQHTRTTYTQSTPRLLFRKKWQKCEGMGLNGFHL